MTPLLLRHLTGSEQPINRERQHTVASPCVSTPGRYSQHTAHVATNYSLALNISACRNQSQGWVPRYWPFCRSERHQLWKAVTMSSVTLLLGCEQHFTDHGSGLSRWDHCYWEMKDAKLLVLNNLLWYDMTSFIKKFKLANYLSSPNSLSPVLLSGYGVLLLRDCSQNQPPEGRGELPLPCWPYGQLIMHWQSILMRVHNLTETSFWAHTDTMHATQVQ